MRSKRELIEKQAQFWVLIAAGCFGSGSLNECP